MDEPPSTEESETVEVKQEPEGEQSAEEAPATADDQGGEEESMETGGQVVKIEREQEVKEEENAEKGMHSFCGKFSSTSLHWWVLYSVSVRYCLPYD